MSTSTSHLVQILLPKETGKGEPIGKDWFDGFLKGLSDRYGGATSFLRSPGQGLWQSGGGTEKDSIAVSRSWRSGLTYPALLAILAREAGVQLSQDEIVIRAQEIRRL